MMINYKIIEYLKDEFKLLENLFDIKDLEILARYIFNNKKLIDLEDLSGDIYDISVLKFAIRRRIQKEPISQIIGLRKFWNSNFYINETVLDPRPESELIVEKVLELSNTNLSLIDLGTGSGCLAISIALERPNFKIFASDISLDALQIAKINSKYYKYDMIFNIVLLCLTIGVNYLLIPIYGIDGAAMATAISLFIFYTIKTFFVYFKLKMHPFTKKTFYTIASFFIIYFLIDSLFIYGEIIYINILIKSCLIILCFIPFLFYLNLSKELIDILKEILRIKKLN